MGKLFDKVLSILTIPDRNTNQTDVNSTDLYEVWKHGDGQYLLPLLLVLVVIFCLICAIFHSCIWLVCSCVHSVTSQEQSEKSERSESRSWPMKSSKEVMAKSEESEKLFIGDGTPRSRKSLQATIAV